MLPKVEGHEEGAVEGAWQPVAPQPQRADRPVDTMQCF